MEILSLATVTLNHSLGGRDGKGGLSLSLFLSLVLCPRVNENVARLLFLRGIFYNDVAKIKSRQR